VKKTRTGSAPGPGGIPYKFYMKCPKLEAMATVEESTEERYHHAGKGMDFALFLRRMTQRTSDSS